MFRLANGIGGIAKMIRAPEQSGAGGGRLAGAVIRIAIEARVGGLMNHADNALAFHSFEIDPHEIVVRQVHDAVPCETGSSEGDERKKNASRKKFHSRGR